LILIENESRRFINQAIELEKDLITFETRAKFRGMILLDNEEYNKMRTKLVNIFSKINNVKLNKCNLLKMIKFFYRNNF